MNAYLICIPRDVKPCNTLHYLAKPFKGARPGLANAANVHHLEQQLPPLREVPAGAGQPGLPATNSPYANAPSGPSIAPPAHTGIPEGLHPGADISSESHVETEQTLP